MPLAETAELAVRISLKDNASAGIRGLQGNLSGLSSSVGRVGRGFGQIGTGLARAGLIVGGAAITGIGLAAKAAIDFEDAFAGVRKTVDETELKAAGLTFDDLATSFRNMATEIPIAATDLARLGETAGALGVHVQDIDDFVEVTAKLGETTNLSADEAAEALGKIGTILGLTGDEYEHFADILVNLGNKGASTESEIIEVAKRFAGVGRQAGLTTEQILALSSTITSLGAEPEAGGSALSRIFSNIATEIANATDKGKAFSKLTGDSLDELKQRINRGDALGIFRETLEGIAKLSRTEQASVLKALGITNVRDRDAIIKMANDTKVLDKNLENAGLSAGALGIEFEKRVDTTRSKLILLKNNAKELGIVFGNEVLPSIKRAAKKAIEFLKDPEVRESARRLGQDVGAFIDNINWDDVKRGAMGFVDMLKSAADWTAKILGLIDKLPGEVKAAAGAFIVLNKLSGGLLAAGAGNVIGGIAETVVRAGGSKLPGIGKLFAQPVFVTNWPMGGLGGVGGGATGRGGGLLGGLLRGAGVLAGGALVANSNAGEGELGFLGNVGGGALAGGSLAGPLGALAGGLTGIVKSVAEVESARSSTQAAEIGRTLHESLAGRNTVTDLQQKLAGIDQGIADFQNTPFAVLLHGDAYNQLVAMREEVVAELEATQEAIGKNLQPLPEDITKKQQKHFDRLRDRTEANRIALVTVSEKEQTKMDNIRAAEQAVRDRVEANRIATQTGLSNVRGATQTMADRIVTALYATRSVTNVLVSVSNAGIQQRTYTSRIEQKQHNSGKDFTS